MFNIASTPRLLVKFFYGTGAVLVVLGMVLSAFVKPVSANNGDKSSLSFEGSCSGGCNQIEATLCNRDGEDMAGPTSYEVWYNPKGGAKKGTMVFGGGYVPALKSGECTTLSYSGDPLPAGNYQFKAYQSEGHNGIGELWSEECHVGICELPTPTATVPEETPDPTMTPTVEEPEPTPTDTSEPTATPEIPGATATNTPLPTVVVTELTPVVTATHSATKTPKPTATEETKTPKFTKTPKATATNTAAPTDTEEPPVDPTATATLIPSGGETPVVPVTGDPTRTPPVNPQAIATLPAPAGNPTGQPQVLVPVTGLDDFLAGPTGLILAQAREWFFNLGLAFFGLGLIAQGYLKYRGH